jgi:hypothetical protein
MTEQSEKAVDMVVPCIVSGGKGDGQLRDERLIVAFET